MTTPTPDKPWRSPSAPEQFAAAWAARHPAPTDLPDATAVIPYVIDQDGRPQFTPSDYRYERADQTPGYSWVEAAVCDLVSWHFELTTLGALSTQDDRDIALTLEVLASEIRKRADRDDADAARKAEGEGAK